MAKTYVATVRLNVEDIATIAGYAAQNRSIIQHRSDPVTIGIELVARIIRDNHPGLTFNLLQSVEFLNHLGIGTVEGNRGARELFNQMGRVELDYYDKTVTCPEPEEPGLEEAKKIFEETYRREEDEKARRARELLDQIKGFQDITGLDVEE